MVNSIAARGKKNDASPRPSRVPPDPQKKRDSIPPVPPHQPNLLHVPESKTEPVIAPTGGSLAHFRAKMLRHARPLLIVFVAVTVAIIVGRVASTGQNSVVVATPAPNPVEETPPAEKTKGDSEAADLSESADNTGSGTASSSVPAEGGDFDDSNLPPGPLPLPVHAGSEADALASEGAPGVERQPSGDLANLIERVEPAVVRINLFDNSGERIGHGSGFLVDANGTVATNYHVIEGADRAELVYADGTISPVTGYIQFDKERDLAILRAATRPSPPSPLPLARSEPKKGERVLSIGAPKDLAFSVSEGIVSAIRRSHEDDVLRAEYGIDTRIVQTTAAISRGNSGGPLLNMAGEVVGVTTSSRVAGQNLNFAVSAKHLSGLLHNVGPARPIATLPKPPRTAATSGFPEDRKPAFLEIILARRDELLAKKRYLDERLQVLTSAINTTDVELTTIYSRMKNLNLTISHYDAQIRTVQTRLAVTSEPAARYQLESNAYALSQQRKAYYDQWNSLDAKAKGVQGVRQDYVSQLQSLQRELQEVYHESSRLEQEWFKLIDPWRTLAEGDHEQVESDLTLWIFLNPRSPNPYVARAYCYTILGRFDEALEDYRRAEELAPKFAMIYGYRGWTLMRKGKYQDALNDFKRCIELDKNYPNLSYSRARCYFALGRYHAAVRDYRRAIAENSQNYYAHRDLAHLFAMCPDKERRDGEQAVKYAEKSCDLTRWSDWSCLDTLASARAETREFESAVKWQTKAWELAPDREKVKLRARLGYYQQEAGIARQD